MLAGIHEAMHTAQPKHHRKVMVTGNTVFLFDWVWETKKCIHKMRCSINQGVTVMGTLLLDAAIHERLVHYRLITGARLKGETCGEHNYRQYC